MGIRRSSAGALVIRRRWQHLSVVRWMYVISALILTVSSVTTLLWVKQDTSIVQAAPGDPVITSIVPDTGPISGGGVVTINGSDFQSGINFDSISVGGATTCGLSAGKAYCWGAGTFGQLGDGSSGVGNNKSLPVAVDTSGVLAGVTLTQIELNYSHTCALSSAGKVYCWGSNQYGQLGNNSTVSSSVPVEVGNIESGGGALPTISKITVGNTHTCAAASSGGMYCWGQNNTGQIGNGLSGAGLRMLPAPVRTATGGSGPIWTATVTSISAGYGYTCGVAGGAAYCWGVNKNGKLGDNTTTTRTIPTAVYTSGVLSGKTVTQITASAGTTGEGLPTVGWSHTCVITTETSANAYCWGRGSWGQMVTTPQRKTTEYPWQLL